MSADHRFDGMDGSALGIASSSFDRLPGAFRPISLGGLSASKRQPVAHDLPSGATGPRGSALLAPSWITASDSSGRVRSASRLS